MTAPDERPGIHALLTGPATLTVPEAGRYLGLDRSASYAAARKGQLPTIRLGERRLMVSAAFLAEMLGAAARLPPVPWIPEHLKRQAAYATRRAGVPPRPDALQTP